ncbi:MAG: sulfatase-like hydrolase/transferase [Chloroflexota bacterium]
MFLYFAPNAPHGPATPARRHRAEFSGKMVRRDLAFNEFDVSDKPSPMQAVPPLTATEIAALDREERDRLRVLLAADEAIDDILRALERAGRLDNCAVFVLSDNGYQLGQHRLASQKGAPYDDSVRVPMLAWGAGFRERRDDRLVANVDIAPTVAGLAGVKFRKADGIDLLGGESRDFVPLQMPGNQQIPPGTGLRSPELVYMEYDTGEREFYDRRVDPLELANLLPPGSSFAGPSPEGLPPVAYLNARTRELTRCVRRRCRT